jgi:hypothetical protein
VTEKIEQAKKESASRDPEERLAKLERELRASSDGRR